MLPSPLKYLRAPPRVISSSKVGLKATTGSFNKAMAADTHAGQEHDIYLPEGPKGSDLLPGAELPPVGHLPGPEEKLSAAVVDPLVQNPPGSNESRQSRDLDSRHRHKKNHTVGLRGSAFSLSFSNPSSCSLTPTSSSHHR